MKKLLAILALLALPLSVVAQRSVNVDADGQVRAPSGFWGANTNANFEALRPSLLELIGAEGGGIGAGDINPNQLEIAGGDLQLVSGVTITNALLSTSQEIDAGAVVRQLTVSGRVKSTYYDHITNAFGALAGESDFELDVWGEHQINALTSSSDSTTLSGHGLLDSVTNAVINLRPGSRVFAENYGSIVVVQNFSNLTVRGFGSGTIDGTRAGVGDTNYIAAGLSFRGENWNPTVDGVRFVNLPNQGISHLFTQNNRATKGTWRIQNNYFDNIGQTNFFYAPDGAVALPDGNAMSGIPHNSIVTGNVGRRLWRGFVEWDSFDLPGQTVEGGLVANNDVEYFWDAFDTRTSSDDTTTFVNTLITGNIIKAMDVPIALQRQAFWLDNVDGMTITGNQIHLGTNYTIGERGLTTVGPVSNLTFTDNDVYGGNSALYQATAGTDYLSDFTIDNNRFHDTYGPSVFFRLNGGTINNNRWFDGGESAGTNAFLALIHKDGEPSDNVEIAGNTFRSTAYTNRTGFLSFIRDGGLGSYVPTNIFAFHNNGTLLAGDTYAHINTLVFTNVIQETGTLGYVRKDSPTFSTSIGLRSSLPRFTMVDESVVNTDLQRLSIRNDYPYALMEWRDGLSITSDYWLRAERGEGNETAEVRLVATNIVLDGVVTGDLFVGAGSGLTSLPANVPLLDAANNDFTGNISAVGASFDTGAFGEMTIGTNNVELLQATNLVAINGLEVPINSMPAAKSGAGTFAVNAAGEPVFREATEQGGSEIPLGGGAGSLPSPTLDGSILLSDGADFSEFDLGMFSGTGSTTNGTATTPLLTNSVPLDTFTRYFFDAQAATYTNVYATFSGSIGVWNQAGTLFTNAAVITEVDAATLYGLSFTIQGATNLVINGTTTDTNDANWSILQSRVLSTPTGEAYVSPAGVMTAPGTNNLAWMFELDDNSGTLVNNWTGSSSAGAFANIAGTPDYDQTALVTGSTNSIHFAPGEYAIMNNGYPVPGSGEVMAVSFVMRVNGSWPASSESVMGSWRTDIGRRSWQLKVSSGGALFSQLSTDGTSTDSGSAGGTLTLDTVHHITYVVDNPGNEERLYLDGALIDTDPIGGSGTMYQPAVGLYLNAVYADTDGMNLTLDQLFIWEGTTDADLGLPEALWLYDGGDGRNSTDLRP